MSTARRAGRIPAARASVDPVVVPDDPLTAPTLCAAFQLTAAAGGDRPALLTYGSDEAVTWTEYAQRVRAVATGLSALGVQPGETVALLLRNRPVFNVVDTAVLHLGAVPFSIYHTEPEDEMVALITDSEAQVLVTEPRFLDQALAVAARAERA